MSDSNCGKSRIGCSRLVFEKSCKGCNELGQFQLDSSRRDAAPGNRSEDRDIARKHCTTFRRSVCRAAGLYNLDQIGKLGCIRRIVASFIAPAIEHDHLRSICDLGMLEETSDMHRPPDERSHNRSRLLRLMALPPSFFHHCHILLAQPTLIPGPSDMSH